MSYGERRVLDGVDFRVNKGDRIAFIGDNGAGKSTLFKIIKGIITPDGGDIIYHGNTIVGFLSQNMSEQDLSGNTLKPVKLIDLETKMHDLERAMSKSEGDALTDLMNEYSNVQAEYESFGGYDYDHRLNDALGGLNDVLTQISSQLERRHKDEAYARLYEQEKRRYLSSGTPRRLRQTFEEWLYDVCNGQPSMDDINDYVTEKLVHMFEKGVFNTKVEHIQRAARYPAEFDFSQLDDDHKLKKSIHKHYSELRKMVDYCDGCLVVNPVKVGRHFYTNRKEENAKGHRNAFLKYMYKISLAQEERRKLLETEAPQTGSDESSLLPDVLATGMAIKYWKRLQQAGFVDERYLLLPITTRKQAMYIADVFSDKLQMRSKWKPFQELWHINNLAQEKWEMQETGKSPARSEEIDKIFED